MSVLSPESRAAPGTTSGAGTAFAYRRTHPLVAWFGGGRGNRLALALFAGLLGELLTGWSGSARLVPLPLTPFVSVTSGLLFGWLGILGATAGQLVAVWVLRGSFLAASTLSVSFAFTGVCALLVFRYAPGMGRGLPNLRSYLLLLGSALAGGLLGGLFSAILVNGPVLGAALAGWVWARASGALMSVLLLAPPALLAMDRWGRDWRWRNWLVPLPGEEQAGNERRNREITGRDEETLILEAPPARTEIRRDLLLGAGMVLAVTALAVPLARLVPQASGWITLLYLGPILWAALQHGLRGGVLAASASGLCFLLAGGGSWAARTDLLLLSLAAAFVGRSREREAQMREELMDTNRLLRRDLLRVAQALTQAVEAKDAYTEGHLRRVSAYAVAVGEKLGLRGQALETLHYASMLHDIGKLGVPEQVLRKDGPLDAHETEIMRRHPEIGARMLEKLDLLNGTAPLVLHHQERFDGNLAGTNPGYPRGLSGDAIPLGARIIAVVDAFDAMTTDRPYRQAFTVEQAAAVLRRERGKQFDPRVVDAFLDSLSERPWRQTA
jgi:MFS family permease